MSDIRELIRNSPFDRSCYSVEIPLIGFHRNLMMFINAEKHEDGFTAEEIFTGVPDFQRDNDKWTEAMQVKFIENIIMGCKTTVMMYEIPPQGELSGYCNCSILDGLQRITAIHRFVTGEIKAFSKSYDDLRSERILSNVRCRIKVNIYTFGSEKEAIGFYIAINENITHSSEDINKAKRILSEADND